MRAPQGTAGDRKAQERICALEALKAREARESSQGSHPPWPGGMVSGPEHPMPHQNSRHSQMLPSLVRILCLLTGLHRALPRMMPQARKLDARGPEVLVHSQQYTASLTCNSTPYCLPLTCWIAIRPICVSTPQTWLRMAMAWQWHGPVQGPAIRGSSQTNPRVDGMTDMIATSSNSQTATFTLIFLWYMLL